MPARSKTLLFLLISILLGICLVCFNAYAGEKPQCGSGASTPTEVFEIAPGVFLRQSRLGQVFEQEELANIGFIVGSRCIAVIDTGGSPKEGDGLRCAIKKQSDKPICYVINTHVHPDHFLGNQSFTNPGVEFVGHKNLPRAISLLGQTYIERFKEITPEQSVQLQPPTLFVENQLKLDLGDRHLLLRAFNSAHTDNDITVTDLTTQTIWAGDLLFSDHVPILGGSGSINGFIQATQELAKLSAKIVIPGHGPVSNTLPKTASIQIRYLRELRDRVRNWISDNGDIGPAVEQLGSSFSHLAMFDEFHKRNVSYAYTELEWE